MKVNAVGEHELLWNDDVDMGSELSKKPHVAMDDLKLEGPVILGKIEIKEREQEGNATRLPWLLV